MTTVVLRDVTVAAADTDEAMLAAPALTELDGDAYEIRITVDQAEALTQALRDSTLR